MVPSAFVVLDRCRSRPTARSTARALPAPERLGTRERHYVAPRTPIEELLAAIWAEVLRLERVGVHDNFFELGGHSLLATQVIVAPARGLSGWSCRCARCSRRRRWPVWPSASQQHGRRARAGASRGVATQAASRTTVAAVVRPAAAVVPRSAGTRAARPTTCRLRCGCRGALDGRRWSGASTRSSGATKPCAPRFRRSTDGQPVQVIAPARELAAAGSIDLRALAPASRGSGSAAPGAAKRRSARSTWRAARCCAAMLLRLADEEHVLLLTMHHIVSDGWSMGVLVARAGDALRGVLPRAGRRLCRAAGPVRRLSRSGSGSWLQGERARQGSCATGSKQLAGAPTSLELPTDRPRPAVQTFRGAQRARGLAERAPTALEALEPARGRARCS